MNAIPVIKDPDIYNELKIKDSPFVLVKSSDLIDVCMQYPKLHMKNATDNCWLRIEVYEALLKAAMNLPQGLKFRIWDAWRPFSLQSELYDAYSKNIIKEFNLENESQEEIRRIIHKFVSEPIKDVELPPVHTTGGAIDLTIVDENGVELKMGTEFDAFTDKTQSSFYEINNIDNEVRDNRRLLYNIMTNNGFTNLPSEWWHFDLGDRFWAYYNKKPAVYCGVFEEEGIDVYK